MVSIDEDAARTLGVKLGDTIELSGGGTSFTARVVALHRVEQMRVGAANEFVFNPAALDRLARDVLRRRAHEAGRRGRAGARVPTRRSPP